MITNEVGQALHDKVVQGVELPPEEQAQLQEWYDILDREEMELLKFTSEKPEVSTLQIQVDKTAAQLSVARRRIQEVAPENDTLRREISLEWANLISHEREARINEFLSWTVK